jgi:beta-phosphoglucomutase
MIRGVLFDLDGVLVSTDEQHYLAWKKIADAEGIPFDRHINHRLRGVSRMDSLNIILEKAKRSYSPQEKEKLAAQKNDFYRQSLQQLTPASLLPGAAEMLAQLRRRGIKSAIGSVSKNTPLILERTGLAGKVDAVVDGNDITRSKPDPEVFLVGAQRLGLKPVECLVVEDAPAGIEAARRAGMAFLGIGSPANLPGVKNLAKNLADITVDALLAIA